MNCFVVMYRLPFISLVIALLLSVLPFHLAAGVTHLLHESHSGDCVIRASHDAVPGQKGVLDIRASRGLSRCGISRQQASEILDSALEALKARNDLSEIESIFLGRLVISFPWISEYLVKTASKDTGWNERFKKPVLGFPNQYVGSVLDSKDILEPFTSVLHKYGFMSRGVSCEKVLLNQDKVPYDAMCWITIK